MATPEFGYAVAKDESHVLHLYGDDDARLARDVGDYLRAGLSRGGGALVIATREHQAQIWAELEAAGYSCAEAERTGRLLRLDAHQTLEQVLRAGKPDWALFEATINRALEQVQGSSGSADRRAFGELVGLLWKAGELAAAIELEVFWNQLLKQHSFRLFCAYPIDIFGGEFRIGNLSSLLSAHTHFFSSNPALEVAVNRALDEVLGPRAARMREVMETMATGSSTVVPRAERMILWLRNMVPDQADEILERARQYYRATPN
ncbi:MAG: MEDS domain-containing protein [Gemmatimonadota bacterium]